MTVFAPPEDTDLGARLADLRQWIKAHCVITSAQERLTDSRGRPQDWVFDLRPALLEGRAALLIAECFWRVMAPAWPFQVAGVELAGAPLLGAILAHGAALGYPVSGAILRRERKTYGRQRAIEGELSELPVVLVDDMLNSGRTLLRSAMILRAEGVALKQVFTVLDFGSPLGREQAASLDVKAVHLFSLQEFDLALPTPRSQPRASAPLQVRWSFDPVARSYGFVARKGAPVVVEGRVLHATEDGWLHAIDIASGDILWAHQVSKRSRKGIWSTPAVRGDALYIGSYDGAVLKLDWRDGRVLWRFDGAEWVGSSPCLSADGAVLYIGLEWAHGAGAGGIACLDSHTGELSWEHPVAAQVHASPIIAPDGDVICGANDGRVRRLSAEGQLRWTAEVGGDVKSAVAMSADAGKLFVAAHDGGLVALDAASGERLWRFETAGPLFATPLVRDGLVACASTDGRLRLLTSAQGEEVASAGVGGKLFAAPVMDGDSLILGSASGRLVRLGWPGLEIISEHQFAERIVSEIALTADTLFVPTFDGQLFAIERV